MKKIFAFLLAAIQLSAFSQSDWENKQGIGINKEPVHATFFPLNSNEEDFEDGMNSEWVQLLNGTWKFNWVPNIADRPADGVRLKVSGNTPLETLVHHYSTEALSDATHTYELQKEDKTYWNVDYRQAGLGENSCGQEPLEKYLLKPLPVEFTLTFEPVLNK